jgi:hypothetical protein
MDQNTDILHEAKRLRLLAAALELQHYTSTAANVVEIPGTGRVIAIGTPAQAMEVLTAQFGIAGATNIAEDVAALFGACGFEIRSTDPAEKHPFAVCGSLDAAGLVVEKLLVGHTEPDAAPAEFVALLPSVTYMDPPDGGSVSVLEQFRRMAQDATRYRWLRNPDPQHVRPLDVCDDGMNILEGRALDAGIDQAIEAEKAGETA